MAVWKLCTQNIANVQFSWQKQQVIDCLAHVYFMNLRVKKRLLPGEREKPHIPRKKAYTLCEQKVIYLWQRRWFDWYLYFTVFHCCHLLVDIFLLLLLFFKCLPHLFRQTHIKKQASVHFSFVIAQTMDDSLYASWTKDTKLSSWAYCGGVHK